MEEIDGFEWDAANVGHILLDGVVPAEVEEVVNCPNVMAPAAAVKGEARWKLFGRTKSGRYLVVVFTMRGKRPRAVTAYDMNVKERRLYAAQVG